MDKGFTVAESCFSEVLPIWSEFLWPGRESAIKPTNGVVFGGGYDPLIEESSPLFLKALEESSGDTLGVISGFPTSEIQYRVRGVFVLPQARGRGVGEALLSKLSKNAAQLGYQVLWSLPRESSFGFYQSEGFVQVTPWDEHSYEFGPNCFALKSLRQYEELQAEAKKINYERKALFAQAPQRQANESLWSRAQVFSKIFKNTTSGFKL